MRIAVTGTRGIPGIAGGVETHCEELYPRISAKGHEVIVMRRTPYINDKNRMKEYKGVRTVDVYAPRSKRFEAVVHTFLSVLAAGRMHADLLHIHAVGPSLLVPFARLLGLKVVMTHHGPDYNRAKWGRMGRLMLRMGERLGVRYSHRVIAISELIAESIRNDYGREDVEVIFNGVNSPCKVTSTAFLDQIGVTPGRYILAVGRFVKEKGFHDLVEAYRSLGDCGMKLVIAGDSDHEDDYSARLKRIAADAGAVLTGYIKGRELAEVMSGAALFVLPSYHEGLPIVLLEAMSYGLDVAVSDIEANRLAELSTDDFFAVGDVEDMARVIGRKLRNRVVRSYDMSRYDWDAIARRTENVYRILLHQ